MSSPIIHHMAIPGAALVLSLMPGISGAEQETGDKTSAEVLRELQALKARVSELEEKLEQARQADEVTASGEGVKSESDTAVADRQEQETARSDTELSDDELDELASDVETRILLGETYRSEVEELMTEKAQQVYAAREAQKAENTIRVHGAVRTQYSYEDYNAGNRNRGGDFDLDTFRINLDGSIGDVLMSAEYRFYQYMDVIHHAWVGYDFTDSLQGQVGIHQVPFGILPFNSHNFFFSSNYYLGLEDDYDTGAKLIYDEGPWNLQAAFYKNDEQGGIDGFVDNRSDRYSYDVVGFRGANEGTFDTPANPIAENNTFNGRAAYTFRHGDDMATKFGFSGQYGDLHNGTASVGDHSAYAVHMNGFYDRWNVQLQATRFEHDLDSGAQRLAVGAYSFFDTIPADGTSYTANVSYNLPVDFGPVSNLTFYNDYSLVTNKSGNLDDTWMNVSGFSVSAGGLFAYFDFIMARNQPFIGGSLGGNADDTNSRLNINLGYYF